LGHWRGLDGLLGPAFDSTEPLPGWVAATSRAGGRLPGDDARTSL